MSIKSLTPSIAFRGTCASAIALYEKAIDAQVEKLVRFADGDTMGHPFDAKDKDLVLHATLRIGGGALMVMDSPPSRPVPTETNVHVFVDFEGARELEKSFGALSHGGTVTMPIQTPSGARSSGCYKTPSASAGC